MRVNTRSACGNAADESVWIRMRAMTSLGLGLSPPGAITVLDDGINQSLKCGATGLHSRLQHSRGDRKRRQAHQKSSKLNPTLKTVRL